MVSSVIHNLNLKMWKGNECAAGENFSNLAFQTAHGRQMRKAPPKKYNPPNRPRPPPPPPSWKWKFSDLPLKSKTSLCFIDFEQLKKLPLVHCVKVSIFGDFLVCNFPYSGWMRRDTEYLFVFSSNAGKYGSEKLRIRTFFTQWLLQNNAPTFYIFSLLSTACNTHLVRFQDCHAALHYHLVRNTWFLQCLATSCLFYSD